jgi:hypothetical protein
VWIHPDVVAADVPAHLVLRRALPNRPRVEAVALEPECGQHEAAPGDRVLKGGPAIRRRSRAEIAPTGLEEIEGDEHGRFVPIQGTGAQMPRCSVTSQGGGSRQPRQISGPS